MSSFTFFFDIHFLKTVIVETNIVHAFYSLAQFVLAVLLLVRKTMRQGLVP